MLSGSLLANRVSLLAKMIVPESREDIASILIKGSSLIPLSWTLFLAFSEQAFAEFDFIFHSRDHIISQLHSAS